MIARRQAAASRAPGAQEPSHHNATPLLQRRIRAMTVPRAPAAAAPAGAGAPSAAAAAAAPPQKIDWRNLKGVLFDIDGTLTNSDPLHFVAFQEILQELGFQGGRPIDEQFYRTHISGRHNPEIAADLFPDWSSEQHVAFYTDKEQRFRDMAGSRLQAMPGLPEFLAWCDGRGLPSAAVTNAPRDNTRLMLSSLGLASYFKAVILGEECERAKPFPDPYLAGLKALGLAAQQVVVFEDSPAGLRAAAAAGIPAIGITSGQAPETLLAAGACATAADFREVMQWVQAAGAAAAAAADMESLTSIARR